MEKFIICGPIVHSKVWDNITIVDNGLVAVDGGKIVSCGISDNLHKIQRELLIPDSQVIHLGPGQFLMPGMVDTHIHAPQYPNAGLGLDKPLLEWLDAYTFPLEKQFKDTALASEVYKAVVTSTLNSGTTTACYYATIHPEACLVLADQCASLGQRSFIGKVNMNQSTTDEYGECTMDSINNTKIVVEKVFKMNNPLVLPIITPRFALSCNMDLMKQLGDLAAKHNLPIQTHISENKTEVQLVNTMYPNCKNYACTYDCGHLLTSKTVLAHGVYLNDDELKLIAERGCSIAHCPRSNTCLKSGNCDVRRLVKAGITVGLGTDVSGGYSSSILDAMRSCLDVSIQLSFGDESYEPLTYHHAFYLATLGGANALSLGEKIGTFEVGKEFDALIISTKLPGSRIDVLPVRGYYTLELVQKFIYCGDDRDVTQVFVRGRLVKNIQTSGSYFPSSHEQSIFVCQ